jgi:predicted RNA-binding protein with PIN domain
MDLAQMQLHQLLRAYCQQHPRTHVLLVYDAHSVAQRAQGSQNVQVLGDRVTTLYTAGKEADTVIIDLVSEVLGREVQAQSQLGPNTPTLCSLVVHTNDNRIKQAVTEAVFNADRRTQRHALRVTPSSNSALSETLQRVENKLQGQQHQWSRPGEDLPDPQHHTEAWARAVLARHSSSSSSSWDSDSDSDDSGGKRRRRRQTQQQQWEQQQLEQQLMAEQLAASLGDEQLLQLAAAVSMDVAAAATASAALEGDADALQPHPAAAAAGGGSTLGSNAAAVAAAAAAAASSSSSAASRELDELLNMDFDSMLDDLL